MMEQKTLEEFSSGIPVSLPILKVPIEATMILLAKHIFICIFYESMREIYVI